MGADSPTSLSAITAAKRREFVSVREAVTKLASHSGDPVSTIAQGLMQFSVLGGYLACLVGGEQRVEQTGDWDYVTALLDATMANGAIPDSVMTEHDTIARSDCEGWLRRPFIDVLLHAGVDVPSSLESPDQDLPKRLSDPQALVLSERSRNADTAALQAEVSRLTAEIEKLREENAKLRSTQPPLSDYLVPIVAAVQREFWLDWDASKPRPKAEGICEWIRANFPGIEARKCKAIELVACPFDRTLGSDKQL